MSTINETVSVALSGVLSNSWAVEFPPDPSWPAIAFEIDSEPEDQWCQGGGYDQHTLTVLIVTETIESRETLKPQVISAIQGLASYMYDDGAGDAEYEDSPNLFAYFMIFKLRSPNY